MATYRIAEIDHEGTKFILIPLDRAWSVKGGAERHALLDRLRACAAAAGLPGTVVLAWETAHGVTQTIGVEELPPALRNMDFESVESEATEQLTCD